MDARRSDALTFSEDMGPEDRLLRDNSPDPETAWELLERGRRFKEAVNLYETVNTNENFFIGKQWEGVRSNGLPTPVFNILKRDVLFVVSNITTDNLKVQATALASSPDTGVLKEPARILSEEFEAIFTRNHITRLLREFARDAAVRGDGCIYTYWDADAENGQAVRGAIRSELVQNTRVHFGNPNVRDVQSQPYIILESRESLRELRNRAFENSGGDFLGDITPDEDTAISGAERQVDGKATKLLLMWKKEGTGRVMAYECTRGAEIKGVWDMGLKLYPIVWLNWDYVQDSYHGQAMITGLIPNQIFINKMWAMSMLSLMTTAYPKIIYDKTRIPRWTNQIGQAIGITGGDVASAARAIDPAAISPQVAQFISAAIEETNSNLGATSVALGDARPDNTSAIIALQRAAATPSEITKQNLRGCVEELSRIYLDFIGEFYGRRVVDMELPEEVKRAIESEGGEVPETAPREFNFDIFRRIPMQLKLDVGASSYYSEIASIQTLDNLLVQGKIDIVQYLERIPDGYIPDRRGLIAELRRGKEAET